MREVVLLAAVVAGVTGAWSPCGFSMVETLAPRGYAGSARASAAACATFTVGALAGGVATFGGLAVLGALLGAPSPVALGAAAVLALAAAAGEARGARILPQIRRQVPEAWRRDLPVPVAAGAYGVLLGLGFTTFVLTFAVWALAAASLALGDPALGLLVGLGFGAGRALPVVLLAPANGRAWGIDAHAAMAERPVIYRTLRALDAVALLGCAAAIGVAPAAAQAAAQTFERDAADPSAGSGAVVYDRPGATGVLRRGALRTALPGSDPQIAGTELAWRQEDAIVIADAATLQPRAVEVAPGADAFAFDAHRLVWRAGDRLLWRPRGTSLAVSLATVPPPGDIGRPSLWGDAVVFHVADATGSWLVRVGLVDGSRRILRRSRGGALLLSPSVRGGALLYVRATRAAQELLLGRARPASGASDRVLHRTTPTARRDAGRERGLEPHTHAGPGGRFVPVPSPRPPAGVTATLWSTALTATEAFVTRLVAGRAGTTASILRVAR